MSELLGGFPVDRWKKNKTGFRAPHGYVGLTGPVLGAGAGAGWIVIIRPDRM